MERYCRERNIPYADLGVPARLEDFVDYGRAFQRKFVPHLEEVLVKRLYRRGNHYRLQLETGAECAARAVIVAAVGDLRTLLCCLRQFPECQKNSGHARFRSQ